MPPAPPGTPRWGLDWKQAVRRYYNHTVVLEVEGNSMPTRANHLSADPTYRDAYGQPLLRITFDFPENDLRMSRYVTERTAEIARLMGGQIVAPGYCTPPYSIVPYQTTHNCGGAVMGTDPAMSVVNRYLQSWDVPNVFVQGASAYPQRAGKGCDRHACRPRLLVGEGNSRAVPQESGPAGAVMRGRRIHPLWTGTAGRRAFRSHAPPGEPRMNRHASGRSPGGQS
jgi:hypothetical protein